MKRSDTHAHSKMSEDYLAKVEKLSREDLKRRHPNSPCYSCQFFRKLDLIGGSWVFKLPNPPNFARARSVVRSKKVDSSPSSS